jgi:general stress protein CsbA
MLNFPALTRSVIVGTILQLAMVIAGHVSPLVAQGFAVGGMAISAVAGFLYARHGAGPWWRQVAGAAVAGGVCALIGILVSFALGDVTAAILVLGTASSAVTGALGGLVGKTAKRAPGNPQV